MKYTKAFMTPQELELGMQCVMAPLEAIAKALYKDDGLAMIHYVRGVLLNALGNFLLMNTHSTNEGELENNVALLIKDLQFFFDKVKEMQAKQKTKETHE